jgi:hypothetical protein
MFLDMSRNISFYDKPSTNNPSVKEAGRIGGLTVLQNRGRVYFAAIGKRGQAVMRQTHPGMASKWGKLGGRPRKPRLDDLMGQSSK